MGPTLPSHGLLHIPDKGTNTYGGVSHVQFADTLQQVLHLVILHHGYHARVHLRPRVGAAARLTPIRAATLHLLKESKTRNIQFIKHILHPLCVRLIIDYHYTFHVVALFNVSCFRFQVSGNAIQDVSHLKHAT